MNEYNTYHIKLVFCYSNNLELEMAFLLLIITLCLNFELTLLVSLRKTTTALPQKNDHQNISLLLDNLLRGYDNSVRPDFGGKNYKYPI